ncbi:precorrin-8X methylmutase [Desulfovibrio aminophilus]|uniref:precorrin-8X methylmutase n=1 Tax=Desulfovibrio aminophilus TaxID=81425 RepID=UPI00040CF852|nr:precorrin-8X methylmutase [Desulfovibrio aminophilus]
MSGVEDIRAPGDIERRSFEIIDSEVSEPRPFQGVEWQVARRMIHTTADFEILSLLRFHPQACEAGLAALASGCLLITDTDMARCGIPKRRMEPLGCTVRCLMADAETAVLARDRGTTKARAAVDLAVERLAPAVWVIGNAPTALLRLLEHIDSGRARPALVVGMPVGFVNAAESKELLLAQERVPYVTLRGRKGGSALAASVINALAEAVLRG